VDKIEVGIIEAQNFILEVKSGSGVVEAHVNFILKNQPIKTLHQVLMSQFYVPHVAKMEEKSVDSLKAEVSHSSADWGFG
jgi:hypothetical protein